MSCGSGHMTLERGVNELLHDKSCHEFLNWTTSRLCHSQQNRSDQGRIEPPKAARGHATSYSARVDCEMLSVTKHRIQIYRRKCMHGFEECSDLAAQS